MTNSEIGNALAEARKARGLSLRDVERDTRISTRYLQALEEGRLEILPAPVYARAFTRTYAQYLGLDAAKLVQHLPGAKPEPALPPLPDFQRDVGQPLLQPSWLIGGAVVVVLLAAGLFMYWNQGGGDDDGDGTQVVAPTQVSENGSQGDIPPPTATPADEPAELVVEPGVVPDLTSQHIIAAITALTDADMQYVVIEVESEDVSEGIIFNQSPPPGTPTDDETVVTILAAR